MAGATQDSQRGQVYGWLFKVFQAFLILFVVSFFVGAFASVFSLFVPPNTSNLIKSFAAWIFGNIPLVIAYLLILILLTYIFYLLSRRAGSPSTPAFVDSQPKYEFKVENKIENIIPPYVPPVSPSRTPGGGDDQLTDSEVERRYLQRMIGRTTMLTLTGIPTGLFATAVPLDEVFIPLRFTRKMSLEDYEFTRDEAGRYYDALTQGQMSEEMLRIFAGKERHLEAILKQGENLGIVDLWQLLDRGHPAAVIQGYPGMGKSTLMARLALHLARIRSGVPDDKMGQPLERVDAAPVPVLLLLKDYAEELGKAEKRLETLSIFDYMKQTMEKLAIPGLFAWLQRCLNKGRCLVMLDGLDEASVLAMRRQVKEAIETFVLNHRDGTGQRFNRFMVTSRVAGYDLVAMRSYDHYKVAELTPEQIRDFLPRWCEASVRHSSRGRSAAQEEIADEAGMMARRLLDAVQKHQGVGKLAENPLMLTLLAVMQQNNIELPRRRVELYARVTETLLERRNEDKNLPPIPEALAIRLLGPIAFEMQEQGNNFASQHRVKALLAVAIKQHAGGTPDEIESEVNGFLERIRVRSGLFVIRTGDYFGFFHRTFQEYFAARYMLNQVKLKPGEWIDKLVERGRTPGDTWREPFLLAVAYQSGEDEIVARKIITQLLDAPRSTGLRALIGLDEPTHDLLLASACLVESKPHTIGTALEQDIARRLLRAYEQAQRHFNFGACSQIENAVRDWLLSLPAESYRAPLLLVIADAISDSRDIPKQRAVLTLLSMIAQELEGCPQQVFDTLIPLLLGIIKGDDAHDDGGAQDRHGDGKRRHDDDGEGVTVDFDVVDLALTALSFMGKQGPAGEMLEAARRYFREYPEHLQILARCSLELGMLLTPTVVPLDEGNYRRYEEAIARWIQLRDATQARTQKGPAQGEIVACADILQTLLDYAEEAAYPATTRLLALTDLAAQQPAQEWGRWQSVWQSYLLDQMRSYIDYQDTVLLFVSLFPGEQPQQPLARLILSDYTNDDAPAHSYAQRFIAAMSSNFRDLHDLGDLRELRELRYLRDFRVFRDLHDLHDLHDFRDFRDFVRLYR